MSFAAARLRPGCKYGDPQFVCGLEEKKSSTSAELCNMEMRTGKMTMLTLLATRIVSNVDIVFCETVVTTACGRGGRRKTMLTVPAA